MRKLIINGGIPLKDCPRNHEEAQAIAEKMNLHSKLQWKFDSGFKLDYDGEIIQILSRFYPPKEHYGPNWDGNIKVYFLGNEVSIFSKKLECKTLVELQTEAEKHVAHVLGIIKSRMDF